MRCNSICCYLLLCFISFGPAFLHAQETTSPTPTRLSLEMAKEILMARNPTLLRERQNIAVARGALVEAKKLPNPEFELSSESYPLFQSNPGPFINNSETILKASQTIETAGKRGKRTAVAMQDVRVSESSLQDIIRQLQLELKSRYFAVSLALRRLQRTPPALVLHFVMPSATVLKRPVATKNSETTARLGPSAVSWKG